MADTGPEFRTFAWTETFPFLRLFTSFKLSIHVNRLLLGLACVLGCYVAGRIMDKVWLACDHGVPVAGEAAETEIDAYLARPAAEFAEWKTEAERARQQQIAGAALALGKVDSLARAMDQATTRPAAELTRSDEHEKHVGEALKFINKRLDAGLDAIDRDKNLSPQQKDQNRKSLMHSADYVRLVLTGHDTRRFDAHGNPMNALTAVIAAAGAEMPQDQQAAQAAASSALSAQVALNKVAQSSPRGPFLALLKHESRCFAAAVQGVCTFHWGFSGPAVGPQPSLLGSIVSAGSGVAWLVTQRPCFAAFYALLHFVIFAFFGGALCRHAAVQAARDETIGLWESLGFAREKYAGFLLAPLVPAGIFLLVAVVMFVGGLVGAIPWIGEVVAGALYGLALLGGFALAMILIGTVLGLHLMWPTIAVEGSDAFDAVTHAVGYLAQRPWHTGFYSLVLLLYGGMSFVMIRVIAMSLLKLTHAVAGAGMSFFGAWESAKTSTFAKLDAIWHMPAWSELSLLPSTGAMPFWGSFGDAPLDWSESVALVLIACWVYLVVAAVGAFVVSFFFCGSTQMYFLLRRDVDAVDYSEIFYEEPAEEELPPLEAPAPPPADTTPPADPPSGQA